MEQSLGAQRLKLVTVLLGDNLATAKAVSRDMALTWPIVAVDDAVLADAYFQKLGMHGVPYYLLLGPDGQPGLIEELSGLIQ